MKRVAFIKKTGVLIAMLSFGVNAIAQQLPADVQEQLKKAQEIIKEKMGAAAPQIQQAMKDAQDKMNADKKNNPTGFKTVVPDSITDVSKIKVADPSKTVAGISADLAKNMAVLQNIRQQQHQNLAKGLPQKGASLFTAIAPSPKSVIVGYARAMLAASTTQMNILNPGLKFAVDRVLNDTTLTPQAQGMLLRAKNDAPPCAVQYMVCKGVISEPDNPWAANTLGVVFRDAQQNKEAVQCFNYAYSIYPCPLIRCNLAWAIFYYGDFINAKKYFKSVLETLPDYASAWEGLGMIAYQEGDLPALFKCMEHQVKTAGPDGDGGAGDDLVSFCGGVKMDDAINNIGQLQQQSNPLQDNSLDGDGRDDSGNQDPPPTADSEYPTWPSMSGIFAQSMDGLPEAVKHTPEYFASIKQAMQKSDADAAAARAACSKLIENPYVDDQGMQVTPTRYKKFVDQFDNVETLFDARGTYVFNQLYNDWQKLVSSMTSQALAFSDYVMATTKAAGSNHTAAFMDTLNCMIRPRARSEIGINFSSASAIFTKHFKEMVSQIDWYITASTPSIKRMHKPDWNAYMNAERLYDIRQNVLKMYNLWVAMQAICLQPGEGTYAFYIGPCTTELRSMGNSGNSGSGPKPQDARLKEYVTPPGPCKDNMGDVNYSGKYLAAKSDCNGWRVAVYPIVKGISAEGSEGPFSGSLEANAKLGFVLKQINATSTQAAHSDIGTTMNFNAEAKLRGELGVAAGPVNVNLSGGASASANLDVDNTWRFGTDNGFIGKATTTEFQASVEADYKLTASAPVIGERSTGTAWVAEVHGAKDTVVAADSGVSTTVSSFGYSKKSE